MRIDNRTNDQLRDITFQPHIAPHATGSVLISCGNTRVICSCTVEEDVPRWMKYQKVKGGWLTAEYNMLPYSTLERKARDISRGKIDGRSSEIQRLIGRSLRAVVDLKALGTRTLWIDCDVLQADGGTRTASISGAMVAVAIAIEKLISEEKLKSNPIKQLIAATSAGIFKDTALLDLNYHEDKHATVDFNVVMTEGLQFVEVQGSGEEATYSAAQMAEIISLCTKGVEEIVALQKQAIAEANKADAASINSLTDFFANK